MEGERVYLDYNATAPLRPAAADAMARAMALTGNPSSVHAEGRAARALVEEARDKVAALVGARPRDVVFTSGGTEAANTVLTPALRAPSGRATGRLLVSATEHASVLSGHRFAAGDTRTVPVDCQGLIDLAALRDELDALARKNAAGLLSLQTANNETGVIQPVAEAAAMVRAAGGLVHTDAVQAAGKVRLDMRALGVDALTLSAHKLGGPQGAGALVLGQDLELSDKLMRGGGQERGWRAGTENVAAISGFGAAAEAALRELDEGAVRVAGLRDRLEAEVERIAPDAVFFGAGVPRLPNTSTFAVPGVKAETMLMRLDLDGIAVSSGSACSSGKVRRSHVLDAMGIPRELAEGAIRVSLGWKSREDDVIRCLAAFERAIRALHTRRIRRQAA